MNSQIEKMTPFIVMEILAKAQEMERKGIDVIHLEVGEPDFGAPLTVRESGIEALQQGHTFYTSALGMYDLRKEISDLYNREFGLNVTPERVMVTSGSSLALMMVCMLLLEKDSEAIITNPGYAPYRNFILAQHARPVTVNLNPDNGFKLEVEDIRKAITPRTRAILVNSPMNPTGMVLDGEFLSELATLGVPVISDEVYHGLVYGEKAHSILEYTDNAFVTNGFSKRFAMTGIRLGYVIAPEKYMPQLDMLHQNFALCAPSISQEMGVRALQSLEAEAEVQRMHSMYDERRRYLMKRLPEIGLPPVTEPKGAFYIMVDARKYTRDSYRFAYEILEKTHVGVTPGVDFGSQGEGFLRISYANKLEKIREAMDRLEQFLKNIKTDK